MEEDVHVFSTQVYNIYIYFLDSILEQRSLAHFVWTDVSNTHVNCGATVI